MLEVRATQREIIFTLKFVQTVITTIRWTTFHSINKNILQPQIYKFAAVFYMCHSVTADVVSYTSFGCGVRDAEMLRSGKVMPFKSIVSLSNASMYPHCGKVPLYIRLPSSDSESDICV